MNYKALAKIDKLGKQGFALASEQEQAEIFRLARIGAWFLVHHELLHDCVLASFEQQDSGEIRAKINSMNLLDSMIKLTNSTWRPEWPRELIE